MLREFRDFLLRGNIVDLAVAFVIGVAFGASFLTDLISFAAVAAAVFFFVVKPMNAVVSRLRSPAEGPPDEERRHQELLEALRSIRTSLVERP